MNTIKITEDNFELIIEKLQKICNKYRMLKSYKVYDEKRKERYHKPAVQFLSVCEKVKNPNQENGRRYKKKLKVIAPNNYVCITKHFMRKSYEEQENGTLTSDMINNEWFAHRYIETRPLIHFDLGNSEVIVMGVNDEIKFYPFKIFTIYVYEDNCKGDDSYSIYKYTFFPDFIRGKIDNLDYENEIREKENDEHDREINSYYGDDYDDYDSLPFI